MTTASRRSGTAPPGRQVLWWGRYDANYSRNRVLRGAFERLGWHVSPFRPRLSTAGDVEARLRRLASPDLVFVPCFRQRDLAAAARFARRIKRPLLFDPLISAWDKQVFERRKFAPGSAASRRLLRYERRLFQSADAVLADTDAHAQFFFETLGVARDRLHVVPVGADEALFVPQAWPAPDTPPDTPMEALFFGSFISAARPITIVEAARVYQGPPLHFTLLGQGPLRAECEQAASGLTHVHFEDWLRSEDLPARIGRAHMVLGIFATSRKAQRVIPNKMFQGMACARAVVSAESATIAPFTHGSDAGIVAVPPGDALALAKTLAMLAASPELLAQRGLQARRMYDAHFSETVIRDRLGTALAVLCP